MTSYSDEQKLHYFRGVVISIVLGPILVVGVVMIVTALIATVLAGWTPSTWFSGNAADWLVGGGIEGDAANYIRALIGALLASGSWAGIRWAFTGPAR